MSLELKIWREACRRIELHEFLARVTPMLAQQFPLELVLIRRLDIGACRLESLAAETVSPPGAGPLAANASQRLRLPARARTELKSDEMQQLVRYCDAGTPLRGTLSGDEPLITWSVPPGLPQGAPQGVLLVPLANEDGPMGMLILLAGSGRRFERSHELLISTLQEPFSMALFLDRQFHELARLREAAEADSRAALSRLGRGDIVEEIVGEHGGLKEVMSRVAQVAPTEAPVLLLGETGSGKEVIARAIHTRSRRAEGPVLRVNCGAIPPEIIDSELFGHERGSFTGAVSMRRGWFERADGGTLFLDEIGELPLAAQVRLLRVLQDGSFERVGGQRTVTVDVRIIAATHMDLPAMVNAGTFRKDLWYRMSVFIIRLPSLREHKEDIPELTSYFAQRAGRRLGGRPIEPTDGDIRRLMAHDWPGNVRELSAVIERAAILGNLRKLEVDAALHSNYVLGDPAQPLLDPNWHDRRWERHPTVAGGSEISYGQGLGSSGYGAAGQNPMGMQGYGAHSSLPGQTWNAGHPAAPGRGGEQALRDGRGIHGSEGALTLPPIPGSAPLSLDGQSRADGLTTLDLAMSDHIVKALQVCKGRIEGPHGAAAMLHINPHTLRARMRKLGINWSVYRPGATGQLPG